MPPDTAVPASPGPARVAGRATVRDAVRDVMRQAGLDTVFGNPGSTELPFLHDWPGGTRYVLALQEASAVAMADGWAQASGRAAMVNLHSAAGVGHALGSLFTAFRNRAPLVVTAGQQARALLPHGPYLGADRASEFPRPYVKWSCEPARAEDVPHAVAQAWQVAMQPPRGPAFVSVPVDDWDRPADGVRVGRVSCAGAPDRAALQEVADALAASRRPALVVGAGVDRAGPAAWRDAVALAERLQAAVWAPPVAPRAGFPEDHPLFQGFLPAVPGALGARLAAYDAVLVLGAPAFTFHVEGDLPRFQGQAVFQVADDGTEGAAWPVARLSLVADLASCLSGLLALVPEAPDRTPPAPRAPAPPVPITDPPDAALVVQALTELVRPDALLVEEAPSHRGAIQRRYPVRGPFGFLTMASGGLGYALPAAVGAALAQPDRQVVCLIGDGSAMYSIQALWTAVQEGAAVKVVVLDNAGYGALKAFAQSMQSRGIPGCDLPGLDFEALARGMGCQAAAVDTHAELRPRLRALLDAPGPGLLRVGVDAAVPVLYR